MPTKQQLTDIKIQIAAPVAFAALDLIASSETPDLAAAQAVAESAIKLIKEILGEND